MSEEIENTIKLNELKFELKKSLKLKNIAQKEQRRKELRCFWSYPFGHLWKVRTFCNDVECACCGKIFRNIL